MHAKWLMPIDPFDHVKTITESFRVVPRFVMSHRIETGKTMNTRRARFLGMATLFQGGLILFAWSLARLSGQTSSSWGRTTLSWEAIGLGVIATVPMLLFFAFIYHSRIGCLVRVQRLVRETLGDQLAVCGWLDLIAIALLAGVSEEFLFRGVLQAYFSRWGPLIGFIVCNVLFGICHAVTPTYALLAALLGCYLSLTLRLTHEPNLLIPIISHSLYDFVAFLVVRNAHRRDHSQELPMSDE